MSDNNESKEVFDRYESPPRFVVVEGGKTGKKTYHAYGIAAPGNRTETFLRFEFLDGEVQLLDRRGLIDVICSSDEGITLGYAHCQIHLMGHRLDKILDLIQDEGLRSLHCFNRNKHELPEETAPVITEMVREMLPAGLPPAQRPTRPGNTKPAWLGT